MKKIMMLLAVAAMAGFASCGDNNGTDSETPTPTPPPVSKMTLEAKSTLVSYFDLMRSGGKVAVFPIAMFSVGATGSAWELVSIEKPSFELLNLSLCNDPSNLDKPTVPTGTYTVSPKTAPEANMCVAAGSSYMVFNEKGEVKEEIKVRSGKVDVSVAGSNYTIKAVVLLENKKELTATYTGSLVVYPVPLSSLEEKEIEMPFEEGTAELVYFGDIFAEQGISDDVWRLSVGDLQGGPNGALDLLLCVPAGISSLEKGIPSCKLTARRITDHQEGEYTCVFGEVANIEGQLMATMSWWFQGKVMGPVHGGDMAIERDADGGYAIEFNFVDDSLYEHEFYGMWIGNITPALPQSSSIPSLMPSVVNNNMKISKTINVSANLVRSMVKL